MLDEALIELLKQTPHMGLLVVLVYVFLRHLERESEAMRAVISSNTMSIKEVSTAIREQSLLINELRRDLGISKKLTREYND